MKEPKNLPLVALAMALPVSALAFLPFKAMASGSTPKIEVIYPDSSTKEFKYVGSTIDFAIKNSDFKCAFMDNDINGSPQYADGNRTYLFICRNGKQDITTFLTCATPLHQRISDKSGKETRFSINCAN